MESFTSPRYLFTKAINPVCFHTSHYLVEPANQLTYLLIAMSMKTLLPAIVMLAITFFNPLASRAQKAGTNPYKAMAAEMLKYVNEHRAKMSLAPMAMNNIVTAGAEKHNQNMATRKIPLGHDRFKERMDELTKQLQFAYAFAENVSSGPKTVKAAFAQWLNSKDHKKNIEGKYYNITGIGVQKGLDGQLYFTQIFIYKLDH